jgi:hypothetical protein
MIIGKHRNPKGKPTVRYKRIWLDFCDGVIDVDQDNDKLPVVDLVISIDVVFVMIVNGIVSLRVFEGTVSIVSIILVVVIGIADVFVDVVLGIIVLDVDRAESIVWVVSVEINEWGAMIVVESTLVNKFTPIKVAVSIIFMAVVVDNVANIVTDNVVEDNTDVMIVVVVDALLVIVVP